VDKTSTFLSCINFNYHESGKNNIYLATYPQGEPKHSLSI